MKDVDDKKSYRLRQEWWLNEPHIKSSKSEFFGKINKMDKH